MTMRIKTTTSETVVAMRIQTGKFKGKISAPNRCGRI